MVSPAGQRFVSRSLPFNPQAASVRIGRAVGTVGIAGTVGIIDGVLGERRAVTVYLVYLVYLGGLVGRTGKSTRGTKETRETRQTRKEPRGFRLRRDWPSSQHQKDWHSDRRDLRQRRREETVGARGGKAASGPPAK